MTKFEIMTDRFEFRFGTSRRSIPAMTAEDIFDSYTSCSFSNSHDPQRVASFDTLEEAQAEFSKSYSDYGTTRAEKSFTFLLLTGNLAWIEENEYDDDGEFDQGNCILAFSAEPYAPEEAE